MNSKSDVRKGEKVIGLTAGKRICSKVDAAEHGKVRYLASRKLDERKGGVDEALKENGLLMDKEFPDGYAIEEIV